MNYFSFIFLFSLLFSSTNMVRSCTGLRIKTHSGSAVYARTMYLNTDLDSHVIFIPRGHTFKGTAPRGSQPGLSWRSRYAAIGANAANQIALVDGINEKGLAGGLFWLDSTKYQPVAQHEYVRSIAWYELLTWILTSYTTVSEVKRELPKIKVSAREFPGWGTIPVHFIIHDEQGESLVIEYIKGKLHLHENTYGSIANTAFTSRTPNIHASCEYDYERHDCSAIMSSTITAADTNEALEKSRSILNTVFSQDMWLQWISVSDLHHKKYYFYHKNAEYAADFQMINPSAHNKTTLLYKP